MTNGCHSEQTKPQRTDTQLRSLHTMSHCSLFIETQFRTGITTAAARIKPRVSIRRFCSGETSLCLY